MSERPFARTFVGSDLRTGTQVVVKTAPAEHVPAGTVLRLEREVAVLAKLHAPELASLLAVGREDECVYLVAPYVPGLPLHERLQRGCLSLREALAVGRCILRALAHIHALDIVHGDVKPANVVVDGRGAVERAVLIDFGLARSAALDPSVPDGGVATARYVSPEQAGLLDHDVDERSDLYSTGILLFECLAGHRPFDAGSVGELLRAHLSARAPALRSLGVRVPGALDELIQRLLRKDPRDRYQSASGALTDLERIAAEVERGVLEPAVVIGLHDRRRTLTEPAFVGRREELTALEACTAAAGHGRGGLLLVEGDSGAGKTRLLDELARRCLARGAWVLRGHGLDQNARPPLQLLAGVAGEVVAEAGRAPLQAATIRVKLGKHLDAACHALPQLATALKVAGGAVLGPEDFGETRTLSALSALLDALGSASRPAVVLLDDCQWADELTMRLLRHWGEGGKAPRHVVVVAAFRSEDVTQAHPLRRLDAAVHLHLAPFAPDDIRLLVESMAGQVPAAATALVQQLSEGNGFLASAVLRGLVESGALVNGPGGWRLERPLVTDVQSSHQAAAFLTGRLELLPDITLQLLSVGAVLGKNFDVTLAADLAGRSAHQAMAALDEARRRHIVWTGFEHARCSFVHDKLREALLDRLQVDDRRELHRRAARRLEELEPGRVFELAYHFDAAGEHERALPYALTAAGQARAQHALEIAEQQYRIAKRGCGDAEAAVRRRIVQELGEVLMLRGRYEEAAERLGEASALASDDVTRAQIAAQLGELAFKRGDVVGGAQALERGLKLLAQRAPRGKASFRGWLLWEVLVQAWHTICPPLLGRRAVEGADEAFLAIRIYSRLAYAYWFGRGTVACAWAHLREMNVAERYPPGAALAQAYSEHAPVMTMVPLFRRGTAYARRSLAIRRTIGDPWGEGQSLHFLGVALYGASRYREAMEHCRAAARLLERTGDRWEVNTANWHVAYSLYRVGELGEAVAAARRVYRAGVEIGDAQAAGISLSVWAKASGGRVPRALIDAELARGSEDGHTAVEVLQAQALGLLRESRPDEAVDVLERAWQLVKEKSLRQEYVAPVLPWLATARRQQVLAAPDLTPGRREQLLREARRAARRARRLSRWYRNNLPHALRESALIAALCGRRRRARRWFDRSLAVAQRQSAQWEHAQTLLARGQIGLELGWRGADEDVSAAADVLRSLDLDMSAEGASGVGAAAARERSETPVTLSLADRFDTVLEAGRRIASALTRDDVFAAVRDAAAVLLRGERCIVLDVRDHGGEALTTVSSEPDGELDELCRELVRRVVGTGRTAVFTDEAANYPARGLMTVTGTRSALCAPVLVRDRLTASIYVSHSQVSGLFGHEEERLAEFMAALAGAALENAEGFAEVQALTRTLEERVEERTAQLAAANHELAHQAFHDPLTQLANRVLFRERVEHAIELRQRDPRPLVVLLLDLDDFKNVNDTWGHAAGDDLLVAVAERLRQCLRPADTVARLGGDEFGVLLEDPDEVMTASEVASRLLDALSAPFRLGAADVWIHASVGVAIDEEGRDGVDVLFQKADAAMYTAKEGGKDRIAVFEPQMLAAVVTRGQLRADLQRAVEQRGEQEFVVHYQPIVGLESGKVTSVEALVRWHRPGREPTRPDEFILLAEDTGLIVPIGGWILANACWQVAAWQRAQPAGPPLGLHVNLSARQLQDTALVGDVTDLLAATGLAPGSLVLEITESSLLRDPDAAAVRLRALKALGVRLALDDFGTGYSSLGYLSRLPIDILKIDKCFMDGMPDAIASSSLTRAIVQLGHTLGLVVVAEGVERPAQVVELRRLACNLAQGYLWSPPRRAEDLDTWLSAQWSSQST